jgi:predicted DNA-binding protein with PD1-like motif
LSFASVGAAPRFSSTVGGIVEPLPLRLSPGADIRVALEAEVAARGYRAAFVIAGIGSLAGARLRLAGAAKPTRLHGEREILTLAGTVAGNGSHLHISVANSEGQVIGGHVALGCFVRTTLELLIVLLPGWSFEREFDPATGFAELVAIRRASDAA